MADPIAPVITIDGPTASGKGAVAAAVARRLGWHYLDSGALYRLVALQAGREQVALDDENGLARLALDLDVQFEQDRILCAGRDVGDSIRTPAIGNAASQIAVFPAVRRALLARQRAFRRLPGLVADGRDMASVVFPQASLKVFLTADVAIRASRRHKQLIDKGISTKLIDLRAELEERDTRDTMRPIAPLAAGEDSVIIDSSNMDLESVVARVVQLATDAGLRAV